MRLFLPYHTFWGLSPFKWSHDSSVAAFPEGPVALRTENYTGRPHLLLSWTVSWNLLTQASYFSSYRSWCIFSGSLSKTRLRRAPPRLTTIIWLPQTTIYSPIWQSLRVPPVLPLCQTTAPWGFSPFGALRQCLNDTIKLCASLPLRDEFLSVEEQACAEQTFGVEMSRYWNVFVLVWCLSCIYLYLLLTYWMSSINQCTIKYIACTGGWRTTRPTWQRRPYGRSF